MRSVGCVWLLVFLSLAPLLTQELSAEDALKSEVVYEVYPCGSADLDECTAAVAELIGSDNKVIALPSIQKVFVVAPPALQSAVDRLVNELAAPRPNLTIEVEFDKVDFESEAGAYIDPPDEITIEDGRIGLGGTRMELKRGEISTSGTTRQLLSVVSGGQARLRVGKTVPYINWFMRRGRHWGYLESQLEWRDVGSYLLIEARVLDRERVWIRLTPELSGLVDGDVRNIRFEKVETELIVPAGETVSIGGLDKDSEFYRRFLVGGLRDKNVARLDIRLTPRIGTLPISDFISSGSRD